MMTVLVLDKHKQPLMPATEKRARLLLERGRAIVARRYPFTIRLKDRVGGDTQPVRVKLDPGSCYTGVAVVRENDKVDSATDEIIKKVTVLSLFQLNHRGSAIRDKLSSRRALRSRRRGNLRYSKARFDNRTRPKGWLAPSLRHRVDTTLSWISKVQRLVPVTGLSMELVRFDMQAMQNPGISGIDYQQGTLQGYEVRQYLLEKWGRKCAYCDATDKPLEIEHIYARFTGGSHRVCNLTLSCRPCNQGKNSQPIQEYLAQDPVRLKRILAEAKKPLNHAAAVNSTRWELANQLNALGLPVELASGGRTQFNRIRHGLSKSHVLDAVCVGEVGSVDRWNLPVMEIQCTGRGSYQRTRLDKFGFPRGYLMREKSVKGFQTGDMVKAVVIQGKKSGIHIGRIAIRASGYFNIVTAAGLVQGISHKYCQLIARNDGYGYKLQPKIA